MWNNANYLSLFLRSCFGRNTKKKTYKSERLYLTLDSYLVFAKTCCYKIKTSKLTWRWRA